MAKDLLTYYVLCRDCLYTDAREHCLEQCDVILIVEPQICQSDAHPCPEDETTDV